MERQMIFHALGIQETKDEDVIRGAYRALLKNANPEDEPEEFKKLRAAYEGALQFARQPDAQEEEKTEIDRWIHRVDEVYRDIAQRNRMKAWEEVLADPVCEDLDTSLEARDAFLTYLIGHIYLPHDVWQLVDGQFQILDDRDNILEKFPKDFVDYLSFYIEHDSSIDYNLFQVTDEEHEDADAYIRGYLDIKSQADGGRTEGLLEKLDELAAFGVYHPYVDAQRLRLWSLDGTSWRKEEVEAGEPQGTKEPAPRVREAQELASRLLEKYGTDPCVLLYCGEARWAAGRREEACQLWERILKDHPRHYIAKYGVARYRIMKREHEKAKGLMLDLLRVNGRDVAVLEDMRKTNDALIIQYRDALGRPDVSREQRSRQTVELGWCLFQNEYADEAIDLLEGFVPEEEQVYSYENLIGRLLYRSDRCGEALPHLRRWLEMICETPDDGSEESRKRISRKHRACRILSECCFDLGMQEEALGYVDMAIEAAQTWSDQRSCIQYKAYLLFEYKRHRDSIDLCDQMLEYDERYVPAILQRQESAYALRNGQQVIDDYRRAIQVCPEYSRPYLLAMETFFFNSQFAEAKKVMDKARESQVEFSAKMRLYEVKILKSLAESPQDWEKALIMAKALLKSIEDPDEDEFLEMDLEDPSEVDYEVALSFWEANDLDLALFHLHRAIEQNPDKTQYRMIRGHIYLDNKEYENALEEYRSAQPACGPTPEFCYNCGLCLEHMGMADLAMEEYEKALAHQEAYRDANEKLADYYKGKYTDTCDPADFEKAMGYLERQLAVRASCYYLVEKGRLLMSAYRLEEAIEEFDKALSIEPDDWAVHNNLGCCYKYLGRFEKAIECLKRAAACMGGSKSALPYGNLADCYEALGDYRKAIWCYEKNLDLYPDGKLFRKEIGLLYRYLGEYDTALKYFQMEPGLDDYYENVAAVQYLKGQEREALNTCEEGIDRAFGENRVSRMCDLAYFYKDISGDFEKAEGYCKRALAQALTEDDRREAEWKLSYLYFGMGRREEACLHAAKSLEHFRNSGNGTEEDYLNFHAFGPARLMRFGWAYICLGETGKGLGMLTEMTRQKRCRQCRSRGCYEGYQHLGMYYEAVGDVEKALECYKKALELNDHEVSLTIALKRVQKL